ncbi:hypothetical protein SAMN02910358_01696 [Lachnospiraceae bacterium XBB1006]|nr:hypothetical protein SAMN02910358_01696 [Lachnospiraceae bacterium XBB1006]
MKYRIRYKKSLKKREFWKDKGVCRAVLISVPATGILGLLYRLQPVYWIFLGLGLGVFAVLTVGENRKKKREKNRFEELADYMQQMLFSFERTRDIVAALQETAELFETGKMHEVLGAALAYLEKAYTADCKHAALCMVEEKYPNDEVKLLHNFMLEAESEGGRIEEMVQMLKEEQRRYRLRVNLFQEQCKKQQRNILLACIAGLALCSSILYLVPDATLLTGYSLYHIGTVLLFWLNLWIMLMGMRVTNRNWLVEQKRYSDEEMEAKLLKYMNGKQTIGRRTLKKIIQKEINQAFPEWMLKLSLLLQSRDVAGAVEESVKEAPVVLVYFIRELIRQIHAYPDSAKPYVEFLGAFKTPASTTFMKMLYTISNGGCSDAPRQLMMLLERNNQMENQEALMKQENALAVSHMLFLAPTLLASFKMILDMSMLLVSFLGQLGMA